MNDKTPERYLKVVRSDKTNDEAAKKIAEDLKSMKKEMMEIIEIIEKDEPNLPFKAK